MSFKSLGLSEPILEGIRAAGYDSPTDIQRQAIPIALSGGNIIGLGETGSGKTAAFGLPMLERLLKGEPGLRAIILVPTRELCVQVAENLRTYASASGLHVRTAFGGISIQIQEAAFRRGLDILVACPGRLIDHIQSNNLDLSRVECLCLDEADRMLDMGFLPQIQSVLQCLPDKRQNCLFSATMLPDIERLVKDHIGEAERVQIGKTSQSAATITHRFENVRADEKNRALEKILRDRRGRVLVFVKRKTKAEELGRLLKRSGLPADSIHGDKGAEQRYVVLRAFDRGKIKHLVATDVAARGIDVKEIELVVNYDMPMQMEDYIHRAGRTGRAGDEGESLSFVTRLDKRLMDQIVKHLEKSSDHEARVVVDGKSVGGGGSGKPRGGSRSEEGRGREESRDAGEGEGGRGRGRGRRSEREESRANGRGDDHREGGRRGGRDREDDQRGGRGRGRSREEGRDRDEGRGRRRSNGRGSDSRDAEGRASGGRDSGSRDAGSRDSGGRDAGGRDSNGRGHQRHDAPREDRARDEAPRESRRRPKKDVAKKKQVKLTKGSKSNRDDTNDLIWG